MIIIMKFFVFKKKFKKYKYKLVRLITVYRGVTKDQLLHV